MPSLALGTTSSLELWSSTSTFTSTFATRHSVPSAMVLQDPPSEGFSEEPRPSDNDTYSSNSVSPSGTRRYPYDSSQFPQPIPIIGPLLGYSDSVIRWRIDDTLKFAEKRINRRLTPEEATALASHLYGAEQTRSYTSAIGVALGIWRWQATMSTNAYPLHTPKPESINPNKFAFIKGPMAQTARHAFRFGLWTTFAMFVGGFVGGLYSQPIAARAAAQDPRLDDLKQVIRSSFEKEEQGRRGQRQGQNADGAGAQSLPPHAGAPRPWGRTPPPPPKPVPAPPTDDMSPTAGNEAWPTSDYQADSGFASETVGRQQPQPRAQTPQQIWQQRSQPRRTANDDEDDASPTGGMFQDEAENQSSGSAWERLRRGGSPARDSSSERGQREDSNLGDSWTFTETEDERKRAQEQAQREFDERLERERQGKDFSDERRW
jgi:hypothetical protein